MDYMDYKAQLESMRQAGLTSLEISRLYRFRQRFVIQEQDRSPIDLAHLHFIQWLIQHGKLTDQLS